MKNLSFGDSEREFSKYEHINYNVQTWDGPFWCKVAMTVSRQAAEHVFRYERFPSQERVTITVSILASSKEDLIRRISDTFGSAVVLGVIKGREPLIFGN